MQSPFLKIEQIALDLKKQLNNPKLNALRKTYLREKIKMLREFIMRKSN